MRRKYIAVNRLTGYPTVHRFWTIRGAKRWLSKDFSIGPIACGPRAAMFEIHQFLS